MGRVYFGGRIGQFALGHKGAFGLPYSFVNDCSAFLRAKSLLGENIAVQLTLILR